jgi:DNA-binding CsgD family transcriptional regulator
MRIGCGFLNRLTRCELECLHWIANGKTVEMTATILNVSARMIAAHIVNIKEKLGCNNLFQLGMVYAKLNQRGHI